MYANIFAEKLWVAFANAKATHIFFFSKNTCESDIVLSRTVNILTTNELVKLTMLWTTGPQAFIMLKTTVIFSISVPMWDSYSEPQVRQSLNQALMPSAKRGEDQYQPVHPCSIAKVFSVHRYIRQ